VYINTSPAPDTYFYGAGKVCINTSPRRKGVFKYFPGFSGAGKYILYRNTSPAPEKYLNTLIRRRRSLGSI